VRRAIDFDYISLAMVQPEASRRMQDRIIIIIELEGSPGYHVYSSPIDFENYTRE